MQIIYERKTHQETAQNTCQGQHQTFNNHDLRNIQLPLIDGELTQAIGRARTIRTEAKVRVFSNFPLEITDIFDFG